MAKLTQRQREYHTKMITKVFAKQTTRVTKRPVMSEEGEIQRASRHAVEDRKLAKHLGLDKQDLW